MAYAIIIGTRREEAAPNGRDRSVWYEGRPCNSAQLVAELEALGIMGVRTYSVFGRPGEVAGVYPWAATAPPGEYRHIDDAMPPIVLSAASANRIRAAILAHVPRSQAGGD